MKKTSRNPPSRQMTLLPVPEIPIVRDEYDIDVFYIYDELKRKYSLPVNIDYATKNNLFEKLTQDERIFIKLSRQYKVKISSRANIKRRNYIIPSSDDRYHSFLGWKILVIDPAKIEALLTHQSKLFTGNYYAARDKFIKLIEFDVYEFVKYRNHFNEDIRLEKIMNWVERNRTNIKEDEKKVITKKNGPPPEFKDVVINNDFAEIFYDGFKMYFDEKDHSSLSLLIVTGKKITSLCFNGKISSLVELFKRLRYQKKIVVRNNDTLTSWICNSFVIKRENKICELNPLTVSNILKKVKKEPSKSNRILTELVEYLPKKKRSDDKPAIK